MLNISDVSKSSYDEFCKISRWRMSTWKESRIVIDCLTYHWEALLVILDHWKLKVWLCNIYINQTSLIVMLWGLCKTACQEQYQHTKHSKTNKGNYIRVLWSSYLTDFISCQHRVLYKWKLNTGSEHLKLQIGKSIMLLCGVLVLCSECDYCMCWAWMWIGFTNIQCFCMWHLLNLGTGERCLSMGCVFALFGYYLFIQVFACVCLSHCTSLQFNNL